MLYGLGEQTLYLAVTGPHLLRQPAHLCDIEAAEQDEQRQNGNDDDGKPRVLLQEVEERTEEHGRGGERVGQCFGKECHNGLHVLFQSVDDVAAVVSLPSAPL